MGLHGPNGCFNVGRVEHCTLFALNAVVYACTCFLQASTTLSPTTGCSPPTKAIGCEENRTTKLRNMVKIGMFFYIIEVTKVRYIDFPREF